MKRYIARDVMYLTESEVWNLPDLDVIEVVLDDGEITTSTNELIFSWYIWSIHRNYPETPLLKTHFLIERLTGSSHVTLLSNAIFDSYDTYAALNKSVDMEHMAELAFRAYNDLYNALTTNLEAYVDSSCALDIIDVMLHPDIAEANHKLQTKKTVSTFDLDECNETIANVLRTAPELASNGISKAIRAGVVKMNQVLQCVGARGFVTDVDSFIFKHPIRVGYAHGIETIADLQKDSRTASQSLMFTKGPMQDSEYFNRSEQLAASSIHGIYPGNCGTKNYLDVTVNNRALLNDMCGKIYLDPVSKTERAITKTDTHLIGKTVKMRTVLMCEHPNPYEVCATCFGVLSLSIPAGTNIGYLAAASVQGPVGQLILSNKHYTGSAGVSSVEIPESEEPFISKGPDENSIYLNKLLEKRLISITIPGKDAPNLIDLADIQDLRTVSPYKISTITVGEFIVNEETETVGYAVRLTSGSRVGSLSLDMLRYVKEQGWTVNDRGNFIIDMTKWDYSKPFISIPLKHFSTVDFMKSIESFIKGGGKGSTSIVSYPAAGGALLALHDLISARLSVNLAYMEILVLAALVRDRDGRDYRLPVDRINAEPARYTKIMDMHSLSAAYAYEGQQNTIFSVESFLVKERPRHPLDDLIVSK